MYEYCGVDKGLGRQVDDNTMKSKSTVTSIGRPPIFHHRKIDELEFIYVVAYVVVFHNQIVHVVHVITCLIQKMLKIRKIQIIYPC